ncbi:MAG TPA: MFS transporter [Gaiellaceae bacterium]|nr:MFS transporter [Gaiellaceae bacterium]
MTDSLSLLRRNRNVRSLVASRAVSSAGTWLAYVALTVDVYARTRSSVWVSAVLLAEFLPTVAVATVLGPWLDRLPRRTLLVGSELVAGAVFATLPFAPSAAAVVALALVAGCASAVFYPTIRATLPGLVEPAELPHANALSQIAATSGMAAGPAVAGVLIAVTGVNAPYALNAASFAISAVLLAQLPAPGRGVASAGAPSGYWQTIAAGVRAYLNSGPLQTVVRIWMLASLGGAVVNVGEIFLARNTFHAGTVGYGLLASASGTGLVAGSVLAGRIGQNAGIRACRLGLVVFMLGFGAAALSPNIWVAAACVVAGGAGNAILLAATTLLVQQATDEQTCGHAFAIFDSAGFVALGVGMAGSGLLITALGARGAWLVAAGLCGLAATATLGQSRRTATPALRIEAELS